MKQIELIDTSFAHQTISSKKGECPFFEWSRMPCDSECVFFTDLCLQNAKLNQFRNRKRVAWIIEPYCINPYPYQFVSKNYDLFDTIFTHSSIFCNEIKNCKSYYFGGSWVNKENRKIWPKSKLVSIIASPKKNTHGQILRHKIIEKFANRYNIDVYGPDFIKFGDCKSEAIKDYKYHISVENNNDKFQGFYATEKVGDAFTCGSICIYNGPSILPQDMENSTIRFNTEKELEIILQNINNKDLSYYNKEEKNLLKAFNCANSPIYLAAENYLYLNYPEYFN